MTVDDHIPTSPARESDIADIKPWLPPNRPNTSNNYRRLQAHRRLLVWAYHVEALAAMTPNSRATSLAALKGAA